MACQSSSAVSRHGRGERLERLGQRPREHAVRQEWRPDRRRPAEADIEVGVRLRRRHVRARAAGARRQPPVRRQRQRRRPRARPADRMRLLVVPRGSHRAHGAPRRALPPAGRRQRLGGVLRRSEGQRLRRGRRRPAVRSGSHKIDEHPYAAVTGTLTYHDGRVFVPVQGLNEEVQGGRPQYECCTFRGSLSALDASTGKVVWKTYTVGERQAARQECRGHTTVGPCRRRHLVGADHRCPSRRGVCRHRQRLRRSAAADDRCRRRARHQERQGAVVSSAHARTTTGRSAAARRIRTTRTARTRSVPTTTSRRRRRS